MSTFSWNDILALPEVALAGGRRIPKTLLTQQAMLTKTEQKTLDRVALLEHYATVQKSTTRIPATLNDGYDIQSVLVLHCEMAKGAAYSEVARLLHKCFPNPTAILFGGPGEVCISVALTRKSLAEQGATVVDAIESTGAFDADDPRYAPFLEALAFNRLPQTDLLSYLEAIIGCVRLSQAISPLGFYPHCELAMQGRLFELVADYGRAQREMGELAELRRDKDMSLNESAKIRMQMKQKKKSLDTILEGIKGLCDVV